ncbi:hypothetical protein VCRA2114E365_130114 [Vibrio crassostreae]|nr:hypothetical protein VCRA2115O371_120033 [Vibrio crassostreae]CAK1745889.1 hypothetical protein VCRA2114O367_130034 [Vibrio crassostreae]CAK1746612.1 hypothetical protein VCRA2113O354_130034 [Vibrio crassostreae]CAK1747423.1 hypothetical protein VCRA2117O376_130033 [Vibrio crassostreae]CAK1747808.1 hypothetical protein VCRA2113O362_130033 [Vibrio crassostreae]
MNNQLEIELSEFESGTLHHTDPKYLGLWKVEHLITATHSKEIGARVKSLRGMINADKVSQSQLADMCGIDQAIISRLERGTPKACMYLPKVSASVGCSLRWLVFGTGLPNIEQLNQILESRDLVIKKLNGIPLHKLSRLNAFQVLELEKTYRLITEEIDLILNAADD